jgi:hypothetical protein
VTRWGGAVGEILDVSLLQARGHLLEREIPVLYGIASGQAHFDLGKKKIQK